MAYRAREALLFVCLIVFNFSSVWANPEAVAEQTACERLIIADQGLEILWLPFHPQQDDQLKLGFNHANDVSIPLREISTERMTEIATKIAAGTRWTLPEAYERLQFFVAYNYWHTSVANFFPGFERSFKQQFSAEEYNSFGMALRLSGISDAPTLLNPGDWQEYFHEYFRPLVEGEAPSFGDLILLNNNLESGAIALVAAIFIDQDVVFYLPQVREHNPLIFQRLHDVAATYQTGAAMKPYYWHQDGNKHYLTDAESRQLDLSIYRLKKDLVQGRFPIDRDNLWKPTPIPRELDPNAD
jgi:hypothetical protein